MSFGLFCVVSAVPQNTTVDDQDYSRITYTNSEDWSHDPLQGYESFFVNGSRSFTYVRGASASFTFNGTGIYLQGPFSNDQALRRVTLDGQDMGTYSAYADNRLPVQGTSAIFWGKSGLANTSHTVIVSHADSGSNILVLDAWIFESGTQPASPSPTPSTEQGIDPSPPSTKINIGAIIGVTVALLLTSVICILGLCFFGRSWKRKQLHKADASREKNFSSRPFRLSVPVYPASPNAKEAPADWQSSMASTSQYTPSEPMSGIAVPASAHLHTSRTTSPSIPSYPFYPGGRAASDSYTDDAPISLNNVSVLTPTPGTLSSGSHYPEPPEYPGAPTRFFEQQPDLPPNTEMTDPPIVNAPSSPSALRRLSTSLAGIIPTRALSPTNNNTRARPVSVIYERASEHNYVDSERVISSPRSSYFPTMTYSPTSQPIPLSPTSARQSQNLDGADVSFKPEDAKSGENDVLDRNKQRNRSTSAAGRADPFADDYAFSSYTRQTRQEVLGP
ncbi:hypothetical protein M408DRAFT_30707 [Serendipita vermifera MAFF 305830]|uniref:Transmembrane protein n=1 Tax=Serendipita vermifera MAFF 305830 TaxID=933852 RepID=A0A0C3A5V3_SERVB|nr:hypothetical protein M408DRAFT_30707 [Serendipita vermifera MAFF 305830]